MARKPDPRLIRRVLDAAQALARETGWPASTEAIAQRARISRSTLFLRFEDKPGLDIAVLEDAIAHLSARMAAGDRGTDLQAEVGWLTRLALRTPTPPQAVLAGLHLLLRSTFGGEPSETLCAGLLPVEGARGAWVGTDRVPA